MADLLTFLGGMLILAVFVVGGILWGVQTAEPETDEPETPETPEQRARRHQ